MKPEAIDRLAKLIGGFKGKRVLDLGGLLLNELFLWFFTEVILLYSLISKCISTDSGGAVSEIVHHDENGLLVRPDDIPALAECMDRLMSNPQERKRLSASATEVANCYSPDNVLALWDQVVYRVMDT
jgi:glycosyltransferase involved in cell wall biosynthesis